MSRRGVASLMASHSLALSVSIRDTDCCARLGGRDGLGEIEEAEGIAEVVVCVEQSHGADLLNVGRGDAACDTSDLVPALGCIEICLVGHLAQVQLEHILAVFLGRCAEVDMATHATSTDERRV